MTDMIDLQRSVVADHIADLEREGAALRAERDRDARNNPRARDDRRTSRRVRLGRWLVAVGEAVAGSARMTAGSVDRAPAAPCDDSPRGLSRAA